MPRSGLPANVEGTIVTVGTFDGVHLGHQDVIRRLVDRAAESGLHSVLVTFDPHPLEVVNPAIAPRLLTPTRERLEVLAETGLDYVAVIPFTRALAALEAEEFVDQVLRDRFRMHELLIGHDHGMGRGRTGDVAVLQRLGEERGFRVDVVAPVVAEHGDSPVSSSAIRRAVSEGDLVAARESLGRPYSVAGTVVHGDHRGRTIGFPTLNVALESERKLLPPNGVYAVIVQTPTGVHPGMVNLGPRPTVGDARVSLEAHLFDVDGDWYGSHVRVDFVQRLRDVRRFGSLDELIAQLHHDATAARNALADSASGVR
jgi:riboflavin kinase/FMN adenylyltransferase